MPTQPQILEPYQTTDLALAAALSLWHPVYSVNRENPRKSIFIFEPAADLEGLVDTFWRGELQVDPRAYFSELRQIKARLYAREGPYD